MAKYHINTYTHSHPSFIHQASVCYHETGHLLFSAGNGVFMNPDTALKQGSRMSLGPLHLTEHSL